MRARRAFAVLGLFIGAFFLLPPVATAQTTEPSIRDVPIAYAAARATDGQALHEGEMVRIHGVVSVDGNLFYMAQQKTFIQDDQAGIALFQRFRRPLLRAGDAVTATGRIRTYAGAPELTVESLRVDRRVGSPEPLPARLKDLLGPRFYGRLVRIEAKMINVFLWKDGISVLLQDGQHTMRLYLTPRQARSFSDAPLDIDSTVRIVGVASQYDRLLPFHEGWQILPRVPADLVVVRQTPRFTRKEVTAGTSVAVAVLLLFLGWNLTLRHEMRSTAREADRRKKAEEYFRSVIENVTDIVTIVDREGTILYQSPSGERALGIARAEQIGKKLHQFIPADDASRLDLAIAQLRKGASRAEARFRFCRGDGVWRTAEAVLVDMIENPAVGGIVINSRDVTERLLLEQQIHQATRLSSLGYLATNLAHEFNNVLMGIQPSAELLRRQGAANAAVENAASHIIQSVERGREIAQRLFQYTRPPEPAMVPVDVGPWLQQLKPQLVSLLPSNIFLDVQGPDRALQIAADPGKIGEVFNSLALNARAAMPQGGRLSIRVLREPAGKAFSFGVLRNPEQFAHFMIEDTGSGIAPELLAHVFEPLFWLQQSRGAGMGLSVVHQIVRQHGGEIFVESTPGAGATFHLFFPLQSGRQPRPEPTPLPGARRRAARLLLVEDDEVVAAGLRAMLELDGREVLVIGRAEKALDAIASWKPDVLILDVSLPDADGAELYLQIEQRWPELPVVFSSGHAEQEKLAKFLSRPHVQFLQKPYDSETLLTTVDVVLGRAPASFNPAR